VEINKEKLNLPTCFICGSSSSFLLNKDNHDLYRCSSCKIVFVCPQPTAEKLAHDLYSYESGYQSNRVEDLSKMEEQQRVKIIFDYFNKFKPKGAILDVGCGNGQMMYWAKKRGFEPSGVELNKRTADHAKEKGFNVYNGFLENAEFPKNSFDFIFLGEIIEHVNNPRSFIKDCSKYLKSGGLIGITTPNLDCMWSKTTFLFYKYFKIPWSSVTPPYHLFQFSTSNLDLLMNQEKFSLVKESFTRIPPLKYELGMLHLLGRYKKSRKITDILFMIFSYGLYVITHTIFKILHPVMKKDFQMIRIYRKN
jgi:2-polyprenyl-3-methyl-5-hydroxy-6-metoxy-1,4-benzoquinol methylase